MSAQLAPAYPSEGYLPTRLAQLLAVRSRQQGAVVQARCKAREQGLPAPCVQQLHLSLFFDGTHHHADANDAANPACSSKRPLAAPRKPASGTNTPRSKP